MPWYYDKAGNRTGPLDLPDLIALIAQGAVRPETLVWTSGMAEWQRAATRAELVDHFEPPPLPKRPATEPSMSAPVPPGPIPASPAPASAVPAAPKVKRLSRFGWPIVAGLAVITVLYLGLYPPAMPAPQADPSPVPPAPTANAPPASPPSRRETLVPADWVNPVTGLAVKLPTNWTTDSPFASGPTQQSFYNYYRHIGATLVWLPAAGGIEALQQTIDGQLDPLSATAWARSPTDIWSKSGTVRGTTSYRRYYIIQVGERFWSVVYEAPTAAVVNNNDDPAMTKVLFDSARGEP